MSIERIMGSSYRKPKARPYDDRDKRDDKCCDKERDKYYDKYYDKYDDKYDDKRDDKYGDKDRDKCKDDKYKDDKYDDKGKDKDRDKCWDKPDKYGDKDCGKRKYVKKFAITTGPLVIEDCSKIVWAVQNLSKDKITVFIRLMKLDPDFEGKDCECCNRCVKSDCATIFKCGCGETGTLFVPEFPKPKQTYEVVFIADGPIKASVQFRGVEEDDLVVLPDDMLPYVCADDDKDDKGDKKDDCSKKGYDDGKKDCLDKAFALTTGPLALDENDDIFFAVQSLAHGRTSVDVLLVRLDPLDPKDDCKCCNRCVKADCVTIFRKCCGENGHIEIPKDCDKAGTFEVVFIANKPIRASVETETVDDSDAFLVPAKRMDCYDIDDICDKKY